MILLFITQRKVYSMGREDEEDAGCSQVKNKKKGRSLYKEEEAKRKKINK